MPPIRVVLIDAATATPIGEADLPPDQLPESFDAATTLHLGDAEWQVEYAEPTTRAAYVASGRLLLRLRRIEMVDPRTILFSLPTLENALPPLEPAEPDRLGEALWMREDDWRQHELVAVAQSPSVDEELAAIRDIHDHARQGPGFARLHVRERIPQPLAGIALTAAEVGRTLGAPRRPLAVGDGLVVGGFAFPAGRGYVYGREAGGVVAELGLAPGAEPALLGALLAAHPVLVVDWCAATIPERF